MDWTSSPPRVIKQSMSYEISFTRRYAMSHRLFSLRDSRCFTPHGHNEYVTVYLEITGNSRLDGQRNMAAPFSALKQIWHRWIDDHVDHGLQLSAHDPLLQYFITQEPETLSHVMVTPGDPTTELLAACFMAKINAILEDQSLPARCRRVEIRETPTNSVVFSGDPAQTICCDHYVDSDAGFDSEFGSEGGAFWWQRPDMSINDLKG